MFWDNEKQFLPPGLSLVQVKSVFGAGELGYGEVYIQMPTEHNILNLISLPMTKKEIIFHLSINYVYRKEFSPYCHGSNCWREQWKLVVFLGQFYNLHLYPEYLYDHRNGTKGEWGLWLSSASAEIGAKFHSRDETEHLGEKIWSCSGAQVKYILSPSWQRKQANRIDRSDHGTSKPSNC